MGCNASTISISQVQVDIATGNNSNNEGKAATNRDDLDICTDADADADADADVDHQDLDADADADVEDYHIGRLICVDPLESGPMLIPVSEFLICDEDFQQFNNLQQQLDFVSNTGEPITNITETKDNKWEENEEEENEEEENDDAEEEEGQQQQQQQRTAILSSYQQCKVEPDTTTTTTITSTSTSRSHSTSSELLKNQNKKNTTTTTITLNGKLGKVVGQKKCNKKGKIIVISSPTPIIRIFHPTASTPTVAAVKEKSISSSSGDISIAF